MARRTTRVPSRLLSAAPRRSRGLGRRVGAPVAHPLRPPHGRTVHQRHHRQPHRHLHRAIRASALQRVRWDSLSFPTTSSDRNPHIVNTGGVGPLPVTTAAKHPAAEGRRCHRHPQRCRRTTRLTRLLFVNPGPDLAAPALPRAHTGPRLYARHEMDSSGNGILNRYAGSLARVDDTVGTTLAPSPFTLSPHNALITAPFHTARTRGRAARREVWAFAFMGVLGFVCYATRGSRTCGTCGATHETRVTPATTRRLSALYLGPGGPSTHPLRCTPPTLHTPYAAHPIPAQKVRGHRNLT